MTEGTSARELLPGLQLDELLAEVQTRLAAVVAARDRLRSLVEAIVLVGAELDLPTVLRRIVEVAAGLANAEYAALGVIGEGDRLAQFVTVGLDEETHARIGRLPHGEGILGLLIREPRPLRLADLHQHPSSVGFPPNHPRMKTFLGVPVRVRGEVFGNLYLTEKRGGSEFDEEDERVVTALATAAGVAVENARLYDQARRRERWLSASAEVMTALLSGTDPDQVLAQVARRAREITETDFAAIALPGADDRLVVRVADGRHGDRLTGVTLPVGGSPAGRAFGQAEPVQTDETAADDPLAVAVGNGGGLGPTICVPLGSVDAVRGVLVVGHRSGGLRFEPSMVSALQTFADQAAVAIELAQRRREAAQLLVYADRDRIARDLHDLVIQRLFASGMQLESATRLIANEEAVSRIRLIVDELDETIRQVRSTIYALQQAGREGTGLRARVLAVTTAAAGPLGFTPSVRFEGPVDSRVGDGLAGQLTAVLAEALSNAARHAQANQVEVSLAVTADQVTLRVADDGVGIAHGGRRSGLANMARRAADCGGSFAATGRPGAGTELTWQAPLVSGTALGGIEPEQNQSDWQ